MTRAIGGVFVYFVSLRKVYLVALDHLDDAWINWVLSSRPATVHSEMLPDTH